MIWEMENIEKNFLRAFLYEDRNLRKSVRDKNEQTCSLQLSDSVF